MAGTCQRLEGKSRVKEEMVRRRRGANSWPAVDQEHTRLLELQEFSPPFPLFTLPPQTITFGGPEEFWHCLLVGGYSLINRVSLVTEVTPGPKASERELVRGP